MISCKWYNRPTELPSDSTVIFHYECVSWSFQLQDTNCSAGQVVLFTGHWTGLKKIRQGRFERNDQLGCGKLLYGAYLLFELNIPEIVTVKLWQL